MSRNTEHTDSFPANRQALIRAIEEVAKEAKQRNELSAAAVLLTLAGSMHIGTERNLHRLTNDFAQDQLLLIEANR